MKKSKQSSFCSAQLLVLLGCRAMWISMASKSTEEYQTPNAIEVMHGSQTARDKLGGQKGKSPDLQLRSQSAC